MSEPLVPVATTAEAVASWIASDLPDGLWVNVGANLAVPRAGVLLAHLTHAPNLHVHLAFSRAYLRDQPVLEGFASITDWRGARWAESYLVHNTTYDNNRHRKDGAFFIGGLQVDPYGNTNLIGIGSDPKKLKFRGPGGIGTGYMAAFASRLYIYVQSHDRRIFVPQCDYVSAFGWRRGDLRRETLGLPGGGPRYCITPLGIFDFEPVQHRMRLKSLHPGVTVEQVMDNTGFDVVIDGNVPTTPAPSTEHLALLRSRIDPGGELRR